MRSLESRAEATLGGRITKLGLRIADELAARFNSFAEFEEQAELSEEDGSQQPECDMKLRSIPLQEQNVQDQFDKFALRFDDRKRGLSSETRCIGAQADTRFHEIDLRIDEHCADFEDC